MTTSRRRRRPRRQGGFRRVALGSLHEFAPLPVNAHWHLTYSDEPVSEPVLWELHDRFGLRTNIQRANVEEHLAWVIVEVSGERVAEAREWLVGRGITVEDLPA